MNQQRVLYGDKSFSEQINCDDQVKIEEINQEMVGQSIRTIARASRIIKKGKLCFVRLRRSSHSIQACFCSKNDEEKVMVNFISKILPESIVEVVGKVIIRNSEKKGQETMKNLELEIEEMYCLSRAEKMHFELDKIVTQQHSFMRLRCLSLRHSLFHHIFKLQSLVGRKFCEFMYSKDFTEIHTPHIVLNRGSNDRFDFDYFGRKVSLLKNPYLHHQLAIHGGLDRIFEISHSFAKNHGLTARTLNEYTKLSFGMVIQSHMDEIISVVKELLIFIINEISKYEELDVIRQYKEVLMPKTDIWTLTEIQANDLLKANFLEGSMSFDSMTAKELFKLLHDHIDILIIENCEYRETPFEMPNSSLGYNNFKIVFKGHVVGKGFQYIHNEELLKNVPNHDNLYPELVSALKYGAQPCGECTINLEAFLMQFLQLNSIQSASMFPRVTNYIDEDLLL